VIDDATGDAKKGVPLSQEMQEALTQGQPSAGNALGGEHRKMARCETPGTWCQTPIQQAYSPTVAT